MERELSWILIVVAVVVLLGLLAKALSRRS